MTQKILKVILIFNFWTPVLACAGGYWETGYTCLFDPNLVIGHRDFQHTYYHSWTHEASWLGNKKKLNIEDWQTFLGKENYSYVLLDDVIYKSSYSSKKNLLEKKKNKTWSAKDQAFLEYLETAYIAQGYSYLPDNGKENHGPALAELFKRLGEQIKKEKFPFLRDRYVFQLIKVMRYQNFHDKAIETYQKYFFDKSSFIKYWAQDHVAGIYRLKGNKALANQNFVQVFTYAPAKRHSSYHGVSIRSQDDWNAVYSKLNNEEKISLHFIRATHSDSKALEDIRAIHQLNSNHEFVDLLVTREINKMEKILLSGEDEKTYNKAEVQSYMRELLAFNKKRIVNTLNFAKIVLENHYLAFLLEDYEKAYEVRHFGFSKLSNQYLEKQKHIIELIAYIHLNDVNTKASQNEIGGLLLKINKKNGIYYDFEHYENGYGDHSDTEFFNTPNHYVFHYLKDHLSNAEFATMFSGETLYFLITYYDQESLNAPLVDRMIDYVKNGEETQLKKYILTHYFDISFVFNKTNEDYINALLDIKATLLLRDPEKINEAIAIFEKLPKEFYEKNSYYKITDNPFNAYLDDCIGVYKKCNKHQTKTKHTKLSFAKTLQKIYNKALNKNSATDYFLLGNAYLNISGHGSSWMATSYYRTSDVTNYMDYSKAQKFYKKALQYTNDRELEAKIHFMLAKCEQWDYWNSKKALGRSSFSRFYYVKSNYQDVMKHIQAEGYRSHFGTLKKQYSNTKLYQQAIKECKYFNYYVKNL